MQEIMQYTTYGIALIGGLAFLVAIIVQVLKELPKLKKIPTSVVALVFSSYSMAYFVNADGSALYIMAK